MNIYKLPLRNLIRKPIRTAALLFLVVFLSFSMFGGSVVIMSLQRGLNSLEARLGADVIVVPDTVSSKADLETILLQGTPGYFYMDKSYLDKVAAVPGVERVSPQYFLASAKSGCCAMRVQIIGFDPETDFSVKPWIESSYKGELGDYDVVVGSEINARAGGTIKLYDRKCRVAARLDKTGTGLDTAIYTNAGTIKLLIEAAEEQGINILSENDPDDIISTVYVKVRDGYDVDDVSDYINVHVRHADAVRTKNMLTGISDSLAVVSDTIGLLIAAIWVMALIIMIITFSMLINERRKEFAVLRVIGTSRRMLAGVILSESAMLGFAGGVIGIVISFAAIFPFAGYVESRLGLPFLLPGAGRTALLMAIALIASVLAGSLASAYSAFRLSRIDTGLILREGN